MKFISTRGNDIASNIDDVFVNHKNSFLNAPDVYMEKLAVGQDLPKNFLSRKPTAKRDTIAPTKAIVPTTIAPIVDFSIPQNIIPPEIQAKEETLKTAPESVPNAVPVPAVPIIEAIEKIPADAPAAPTFPAKALVALRVNPLSSLKTASLTFSQAFPAL